MRRNSGYLVGCGGAVLAIATFLVGLEVSSTTAAPSIARTAPMVNRTLKSDRMPLASTKSRNAVNGPAEITVPPAPAPKPRLLDGCEPVVSAIGHSPLAQPFFGASSCAGAADGRLATRRRCRSHRVATRNLRNTSGL